MTPEKLIIGKFVTIMSKSIIIILIVAGLALFVWVPAILLSARRAMKNGTTCHSERSLKGGVKESEPNNQITK